MCATSVMVRVHQCCTNWNCTHVIGTTVLMRPEHTTINESIVVISSSQLWSLHHYYQATHQHLPTAWNSNAVFTNWIKGIETMAQVVHARQSSSQSVTYDVSHQAFMCLSRSHTCNTHSPKSAHTCHVNASSLIADMLVFSSRHMSRAS